MTLVTSKLDLETGGGSNSDLDLKARAFIELGHEVTVVTAFSGSNKIPGTPPYRVVEERLPSRNLFGIQWGALRLFRKYEKETDVYYFDGQTFLYGAGVYRRLGGKVPVVSFFNRELVAWPDDARRFIDMPQLGLLSRVKKRIRWYAEKHLGMLLANGIDLHSFTSPTYRKLYEAFGLRMKRDPLIVGDMYDFATTVKEHAVMTDIIPERRKRTRPVTLFFSGRLVAMRGVDILIQALSELPNKEDFRVVISGSGPEERALRELAGKTGVAPFVQFTGWLDREAVYQWLRRSDVFVIPRGTYGATSVSLLEAMAFGLPSIVPECGGLAWVAGDAALTFKEDDAHDLAQKIARLASDAALRDTLVNKCFTRLAELDYRKTAKRIQDAMAALTATTRA